MSGESAILTQFEFKFRKNRLPDERYQGAPSGPPLKGPKFREISGFRAPPKISKKISRNSRQGLAMLFTTKMV